MPILPTAYRSRHRTNCPLLALAMLILFPSVSSAKNIARIRSIQSRINNIETELAPLPELLLTPTPWTLGYRTRRTEDATQTNTIDIQFNSGEEIDLIALFPSTYVPRLNEVAPFGFPPRFTIERLRTDGTYEIIVDYSQRDYTVDGVEPQLFTLAKPVYAEGIRLTLLQQAQDDTLRSDKFLTAFSEIMAFHGNKNIALGARVNVSSDRPFGYVWHRDCLVDGFCLFSPVNGNLQRQSDNLHYTGKQLTLLFDLGEERDLDEIRLWPAIFSLEHKFPHASGIDFPRNIRVERLNDPTDSEGQLVFQNETDQPWPGSSPLVQRFPNAHGRYFRLTLAEPVPDFRANRMSHISLSELELVSQGNVLSRENPPQIISNKKNATVMLTDGRTTEGNILPLRLWVEGLSRRAQLERELTDLQLDLRLAQQLERERLFFLIALSICITPILVWLAKLEADRRWKRVRDRMACDLHDEIGANISSLGHMAELIKETIPNPSDIQLKMLDNAIQTARLTSAETRNFIQLLEAEKTGFNLNEQIQQVAQQLLHIDVHCELDSSESLSHLRVSRQWDLLLFIKEALNNITKHAEATRVEIRSYKQAGRIHLHIIDNGKGIPSERLPPRHLAARAKQLHADLTVKSLPEQGTHIQLNFK